MAGINFNDLPQNLQQKLQPYYTLTGSVEKAIDAAKDAGKWSKSDEQNLASFNGNKAWGVFDGFERTETGRFNSDLAQATKSDPANAMKKATAKGIQRDVAQHPEKYTPKRYERESGRYIVYEKDPVTGKTTFKYFDKNNKPMTEMAFKSKEGIEDIHYIQGNERSLPLNRGNSTSDKNYIAQHAGNLLITTYKTPNAVEKGVAYTVGLVASCSNGYDIEELTAHATTIDNTYNIELKFETTSLLKAQARQEELLQIIANKTAEIANNTAKTNDEIAQLKAEVAAAKDEIADIKVKLQQAIDNQLDYANTAQNFYQQVLAEIGNNNELLAFIVDGMTAGNTILTELKALMEQNNADNKEILEAISKCKFGIDKLHEDNQDIKSLLAEIKTAVENLPDDMKEKFSGYFKSIMLGISDNGAKLDALTNLLKVVNSNINLGNKAIIDRMDKQFTAMMGVVNNLFDKFSQYGDKVTKALNAISTAIANLTAKVDKLDLTKVEKTLTEILNKIANNGTALTNITKLLQDINNNTILNGERQQKILEAINKLGDYGVKILGDLDTIIARFGDSEAKLDELIKLLQTMDANNETRNNKILAYLKEMGCTMAGGFAKLVEIGNTNNALTTKTNELINVVIDLLENAPKMEVNVSEIVAAINAKDGDLSKKLDDILSILKTINCNVVQGNEDNNRLLNKILAAIEGIDSKSVSLVNKIIEAINKKTSPSNPTVNVDLSKIESKLDDILKAIKDHKVLVEVDGTVKCDCNCSGGSSVHEGVINDINWLLG